MRIFFCEKIDLISFGIGYQDRRFLCSSWKVSVVCKGEMKELKLMFAELLERLDPGIKPSDNKFSGGTREGSKEEFGCWMYESSGNFCCGYLKHRERLVRKADGRIA